MESLPDSFREAVRRARDERHYLEALLLANGDGAEGLTLRRLRGMARELGLA